jgi:hypothetical protein
VVVIMIRAVIGLLLILGLEGPASAQFGGGSITGAPSGAASGDLGGNYPNPTAKDMGRIICSIRSANFNTTADQACTINSLITAWAPTAVWVTNCTGTLTLAAGGVYPAASKGGTPMVASTQAYSTLTTSTLVLNLTMAAGIATTRFTIGTAFLSLTTAAGSAATCDFYIIGQDLT